MAKMKVNCVSEIDHYKRLSDKKQNEITEMQKNHESKLEVAIREADKRAKSYLGQREELLTKQFAIDRKHF